ncbi:N/A [soil metagenome]
MAEKHLHIVCLNVPYPVDYGGVFDLFYKVKALHEKGIRIFLHCFEYGRGEQPALAAYCEKIFYYKRDAGLSGLSLTLPYIVNSRRDPRLLKNLSQDDHPILLEGIHCTYFLNKGKLQGRKVIVRLHNVEYEYYGQLYHSERSLFKKMYFIFESILLKKYERKIRNAAIFLTVSEKDALTYKNLGAVNVAYLPVFMPFRTVNIQDGSGNYCLYHGNLSVAENEKAVLWLIKNVFSNNVVPLKIAGKNPSENLMQEIKKYNNVSLRANPDDESMKQLISEAHINILPSFNATGVKIKLINALFTGRHCIVNNQAVEASGLAILCRIANTPSAVQKAISALMPVAFSEAEINKRKQLLENTYSNSANADELIRVIY